MAYYVPSKCRLQFQCVFVLFYIFKGESSLEKVEILRYFENEKMYWTAVCGKRSNFSFNTNFMLGSKLSDVVSEIAGLGPIFRGLVCPLDDVFLQIFETA